MTRDDAISEAMEQLRRQLQVDWVEILETRESEVGDGWIVLTTEPICPTPMWVHVPEDYVTGDEVEEPDPRHFEGDPEEAWDPSEDWDGGESWECEGFGSVETEPYSLRSTRSR